MRRMVGSCVFARAVVQMAPVGYSYSPGGYGYAPGKVIPGPYTDTNTTLCLLDGDDGAWFRTLVEKAGGLILEEVTGVE